MKKNASPGKRFYSYFNSVVFSFESFIISDFQKLEAIMSRTRKNPSARGNSPNETPEPQLSDSNGSSPEKTREEAKNYQNILMNEQKDDDLVIIKNSENITTSLPTSQLKPYLVEDVNRAMNGSHNNNHIETFR